MNSYIITNDAYSNQPDEVSFDQMVEMCRENGLNVSLKEGCGIDKQWADAHVIYDPSATNERVVAVEKSAYDAAQAI